LLRDVPLDGAREPAERLARVHARLLGATEEEVEAAVDAVMAALAHPVMSRARAAARVHREYAVLLPHEGRMLEAVIDLAFVENGAWTVVDFKTDADFPARQAHYRVQVLWYAYALARISGMPVAGVLLSV
jgi:ATP-dependent exoDNAse (exonuclease V) beta subunit